MRHFLLPTCFVCGVLAAGPSAAPAHGNASTDPEPPKASPYPTPALPASPDPGKLTGELNDRLRELRGAARPDVPVDARLLRRLNVTRAGGRGDLALLLRDARPGWPPALRAPAYAAERARVEALLPAGARRARAGEGAAESARDLKRSVDSLLGTLRDRINDVSPAEYVEARRFLDRLKGAAEALRGADVRRELAAADGLSKGVKTVAGLAAYLDRERLALTPPLPGDEEAYRELARAVSAYATKEPVRPAGR